MDYCPHTRRFVPPKSGPSTHPWQQEAIDLAPLAPAVFAGFRPLRVYRLTEEIPGHHAGDELPEVALRLMGFRLPKLLS